jgi:hypothetical protein
MHCASARIHFSYAKAGIGSVDHRRHVRNDQVPNAVLRGATPDWRCLIFAKTVEILCASKYEPAVRASSTLPVHQGEQVVLKATWESSPENAFRLVEQEEESNVHVTCQANQGCDSRFEHC